MKKTIYFYSNIVAWALALLLIGNFVFGWTPPSATPPGGNVNLGSSSQWTTSDSNIYYNTGNVGIGTTGPKNKLDVEGSAVIGAAYSGTNTALSNGLSVEGTVGIGTTEPGEKLEVAGAIKIGTAIGTADGTIRWTGSDFEGRKSGSWVSLTSRGGFATSTDPGIGNVYYDTDYYVDGQAKTGTLQRACYSTGAKELGTTGNFCGDDQGTAVAGDICNSTKAWVDGSLITGDRTFCFDFSCATSTDPGISNVYYNTNYYIDGVSEIGTLQRACYNTGAVELGTTGNFCGDTQGTAVAGDICNSTTAWVDGSLKTGNRTACSSSGYSLGVPKTGQTTSYASYDDGSYEKGQALSYTDNGNGTITDNNTGLMWKRCAEPDILTSVCNGTHSTYLWQAAIDKCEGLDYAGYIDWRLPNAKELWSITKLEPNTAPYIDQTAFPGTGSLVYWTSTTYYNSTAEALYLSFETGALGDISKTSVPYSVRCVRL